MRICRVKSRFGRELVLPRDGGRARWRHRQDRWPPYARSWTHLSTHYRPLALFKSRRLEVQNSTAMGLRHNDAVISASNWHGLRLARRYQLVFGMACAGSACAGSHGIASNTAGKDSPHGHTWKRMWSDRAVDLVSVWCTLDGDAYALDASGGRHVLHGAVLDPRTQPYAVARLDSEIYRTYDGGLERSADGGATWTQVAIDEPRQPNLMAVSITRVAADPGTGRVFALGACAVVGNSLEEEYSYLLRSGDHGASWSMVWKGEDRAYPPEVSNGLQLGQAFVVARDGTVLATGRSDGSLLASNDGGEAFGPNATPVHEALADLSVAPDGTVRGVGKHGAIVVSSDNGKTFAIEPSGVIEDLNAIVECRGTTWIVGAHGTVLHAGA